MPKRKVSKTSSSDCSDKFKRDEEDSGANTTSASKQPNYQFSSSENTLISNQDKSYKSSFNKAIKEEREEFSPLPVRPDLRKDSLAVDLDILYQCSLNLNKINSVSEHANHINSEKFEAKPDNDE